MMKMKLIRYLVLTVLMMAVPAVGLADSSSGKSESYHNYGKVYAGLNDFTGDLDDAGYDANFDGGVAYGRYLTPFLVIEGAVDIFGTNQDLHGSTVTAGSYKREDSIGVLALLATIKGEFPLGPLTLFGGGGGGVYFLSLDSDITTANLGEFNKDETDNVFGFHVVAGANYNITSRFFLGLQGLYRWTEDIDINKSAATVPVIVEGDLNGYTVTINAGFRF
jgi:opacity protein-like surface antigen